MNKKMFNLKINRTFLFLLLIGIFQVIGTACSKKITYPEEAYKPRLDPTRNDSLQRTPFEIIDDFGILGEQDYKLGPGDQLELLVSLRPELTGQYLVGPDGTITVPLAGEIMVEGLTRTVAQQTIKETLLEYYDSLSMTLKILNYANNKVFVLGNVKRPGIVEFRGRRTLLEALSRSDVAIFEGKNLDFARCAIIRGKEQIIWIDINELLNNGNLSLNIDLANNDIIYVPEAMQANIYVMGEVRSPGSYQVKGTMSLLDAINSAGGFSIDAVQSEVKLIRYNGGKDGEVINIDLRDFYRTGNYAQNYLLENNDIVYIPKKGLATITYYLSFINPFAQTIIVSKTLSGQ
ncbi:MAG: sugar transporter [Calditrichaeota bacterium]|nr:MAG: sugar transporter [Calditrichota bacterium]